MVIGIDLFLQEIDRQIRAKHLLKHPFYQAWSQGKLDRDCLKEYAKEYDHHVRAFPTYLSAIHARTEDMSIRKVLLHNLMEEEGGSPNHPDLWRKFGHALGVNEEEWDQHQPKAEMQHLVTLFRQVCSQSGLAESIAALYAYESQIPEICVSKIDGLKKYYAMKDSSGWEYFRVHIHADQKHAMEERSLLHSLVRPDNRASIVATVESVLDALNDFLSGICHRYGISCHLASVTSN